MNASPTPTKKRSVKKLLTACLSAVVAVAMTTVAAAWFAGLWSSPVSFPVGTGGNPELNPMAVWMYTSIHENQTQQQWVEVTAQTTTDNVAYLLPKVDATFSQKTEDDVTVDVITINDMKTLHFGRIDNLISLNEDNKIYFRIKLNAQTHGKEKYQFTFDYATEEADLRNSLYLYNIEGEPVPLVGNDNAPIQYDANRPELMYFLQFTYFFSPNLYDLDAENFDFDAFDAQLKGRIDPDTQESKPYNITETMEMQSFTPAETGTGDYYLYLCMTPNLETYGLHENILEYFAHSYMFFDVTFSFEVH